MKHRGDKINADFDITATSNSEHLAKFFASGPEPLAQSNKNVRQMASALLVAIEALENIQNTYGSPNDEDAVTTTAREALEKIRGDKP